MTEGWWLVQKTVLTIGGLMALAGLVVIGREMVLWFINSDDNGREG